MSKLGSDHPNTLLSRLLVASGLVRLGRGAEAAADCRRAAETWEKRGGSDANSLYNATCFRAVTAARACAADTSPAGTGQAEDRPTGPWSGSSGPSPPGTATPPT